ncbi:MULTISPECIES: hypothetical protein [Mobiluncus]|nr:MULTISPECIES: hypothetical protein [Mobiluncus]SQB63373.1 Uncharacterised protein [Mobiluncus curtisii]SQC01630.1 Uncharacterised protein [Mobiluncus curtisii]STY89456.1 Uncharacterised protein [Mobiluncus holmesii]
MSEQLGGTDKLQTPQMFAVAVASTAGRSAYDNVPAFPKIVAPSNVNRADANARAFNSGTLADAVNRLVGLPPFNVPASGIVGILSSRTVANQGFVA